MVAFQLVDDTVLCNFLLHSAKNGYALVITRCNRLLNDQHRFQSSCL